MFYYFVKFFIASFDQFNAFLLNKCIDFMKERKIPTPNFWTEVYILYI